MLRVVVEVVEMMVLLEMVAAAVLEREPLDPADHQHSLPL
jgi:hypothetical protein